MRCRGSELPETALGDGAADAPSALGGPELSRVRVAWPEEEGPFGMFETYGWEWQPDWTMEDNLIALVLATRLNCTKFAGYVGGHCSAVLCRPPRLEPGLGGAPGKRVIEVVGLGVNTPPHFSPAAALGAEAPGAADRGLRRRLRRGRSRPRHNEIHAEVQILARCARAGIPTAGAWMCIEMSPCWECAKVLIAAGISKVIFQCFNRPDLSKEEREAIGMKNWGRSLLAAKAVGMDFVPVPWTERRQRYIGELWARYKAVNGLDRAAVKAMASVDTDV